MLASHFFDPVVGADIHIVLIPTPPTGVMVPTPIPMMHAGWVFDPAGMIIGAAISCAMGAGPGLVRVNGLPATNCLTEASQALLLPHIPAPGIAFATGMPGNDATLMFGALNKRFMGSFAVRLGDIAMPCGDPVRLPTGVVISIPAGRLVLVNAAPAPDLQALAMAAVFRGLFRALGALVRRLSRFGRRLWRFFRQVQRSSSRWRGVAARLNRIINRIAPRRLRSCLHRAVCHVTGHPVDVANGRMFTNTVVDFELPGPLPLRMTRIYDSSLSWRRTSVGWGWSHSLDQAVWTERGKVVFRAEDGREIEFHTHDLPGRELRVGQEIFHPLDRLTLRRTGARSWSVRGIGGLVHEFDAIPGSAQESKLLRIRDPHENTIELHYDRHARLDWVRDSVGRRVFFEHDVHGNLVRLKTPLPFQEGCGVERQYAYDAHGDLTGVADAARNWWRFEYVGHLMVKETDRVGVSFFFQYDGHGPTAKCVRTWGKSHDADGILDHEIAYDPRNKTTIVTDSVGAVRLYEMNELGMVVAETDPHGARTVREYDGNCGRVCSETDALGRTTTSTFDARGHLVRAVGKDGATISVEYVDDRPVRALDAIGGTWLWKYDHFGNLVEKTNPLNESVRWTYRRDGLPESVETAGRRATFAYDAMKNVAQYALPNGAVSTAHYDRCGRVSEMASPRGAVTRIRRDVSGRSVRVESFTGVGQLAYDAEGNLIEAQSGTRHVRLRYGHFHKLVAREEAGANVGFEYDTEDQLTCVLNEAGERYEYDLDKCGRISIEKDFGGGCREFVRDALGRVTHEITPAGRRKTFTYDEADRVARVEHLDKTFSEFEYRSDGALMFTRNQDTWVRFARDALGRTTAEQVPAGTINSRYDSVGRQALESSLGARAVYLRDELGEVASIFLGAPSPEPTISIERDDLGAEVARVLPGGVRVEWTHDAVGRPTERRTSHAHGAVEMLEARRYEWSTADQIGAIVSTAHGRVDYRHDARGRLVGESSATSGDLIRAMDPVGNVYRALDGRDRAYGPGGQIAAADGATFKHDEDGNLVAKHEADGRTWAHRWNEDGTLRETDRPDGRKLRSFYDPFGRRYKKQLVRVEQTGPRSCDIVEQIECETRFLWDGNVVLHELRHLDGLTSEHATDANVIWHVAPGTCAPIARQEGTHQHAIVSDHLGVPDAMYDAAGRLAWSMQLDLFGVPAASGNDEVDCPWRFPGQFEDRETGLFYNRHRFYDPTAGSYISKDPIGLLGGLRLYGYVEDPSTWCDPLGLAGCGLGDATTSPALADPRVGIRSHVENFRMGASLFLPQSIWDSIVVPKGSLGRPDGLFVSRLDTGDRLVLEAAGSRSILLHRLSIPMAGGWATSPIIRVDVDNPLLHNARMPSGFEDAANDLFRWGGFTAGGLQEAALDPVPLTHLTNRGVVIR